MKQLLTTLMLANAAVFLQVPCFASYEIACGRHRLELAGSGIAVILRPTLALSRIFVAPGQNCADC